MRQLYKAQMSVFSGVCEKKLVVKSRKNKQNKHITLKP
jgi:hypothetical protein